MARQRAQELESALAVLSSFDEGVDLVLYFKHLMVQCGHPAYALHFNTSDALSDSQRHYATRQLELFQRWYANWPGRV
jgi:4-hydroxy-tetrahydrodipicolinate synthase